MIEFFPLDIDEIFEDNESVIRLFGRTINGERICVLDYNYEPYFLFEGNKEDVEELMITKEDITYFVTKIEEVKKKYLGEESKFWKVYVNNSVAIRLLAKELKNKGGVYEYDIDFCKRYLVDKEIIPSRLYKIDGEIVKKVEYNVDLVVEVKNIEQNSESFEKERILAFDIETMDEVILVISFYGDDFKKIITWKKVKGEGIEVVDGEEELIRRFVEIINEYKPDYLVSYNGDNFDFPFIFERARKYRVDLELNVDGSNIRLNRNKTRLIGVLHLDLYKFIRKNMAVNLQTDVLDLGSVANEILGRGKKEIKFEVVFENLDDNIGKLCDYCLNDSEITYMLCKSLLVNLEELGKLTGLSLFDVCRASYGNLVENYLMKRSREFNEIILSKSGYRMKREKYEGAFVMEPKPGFYKNLVVFDFLSLYPSIIVTHNIGLGSFGKGKKVPGLDYRFDNKKKDFIPLVIEDLINRRRRIKEIMKNEKNKVLDARSYALKTVANAMYGMFGFIGARWYYRECGESITAYARDYIKKVIEEAKKEFEVIYGDTDSVVCILGNKTKDDAFKFLEKMNKELPELMELELEDFYKRGIFVSRKEGGGAKKRYALINENDEIKIRGFEAIRRNSSEIAKEVQKNILKIILEEDDFEKALEYVKKIIKDVQEHKIDINKTVIKTQITRGLDEYSSVGPHVAVAKKMILNGVEVKPGMVIRYVINKGKGLIREKARLLEESEDYDEEYYINNQIIPVVEGIFEVFGVDKEKLLKEQKKLGDF